MDEGRKRKELKSQRDTFFPKAWKNGTNCHGTILHEYLLVMQCIQKSQVVLRRALKNKVSVASSDVKTLSKTGANITLSSED